jgi:hypothetical protein
VHKRRISAVTEMSNIIRFKPRAAFEVETNLRRFIDLCRNQLTVFGADLAFDENVWDVSDFVHVKGKAGRRRIVFSVMSPGRCGEGVAFQEPYLSFAKAYMRHEFAIRRKWFIEIGINALRVLYRAMTDQGATVNPTEIRSDMLNRAVQMQEGVGHYRANQIALELEKLAAFLVRNHIVTAQLDWKSPLGKPGMTHAARVGKEFDELRARMLPSPEALSALAHIFRGATEPADVLVASIMAILCAAPSRIGEVFLLSADCEVIQNDSKGTAVYGLRWYPEKGAPPQTKPIITSMVDVVREALNKIRALTKSARTVSAWYERHPTELYLPAPLTHLREKRTLCTEEVAQIVFATPTTQRAVWSWVCRHKVRRQIPSRGGSGADYGFADVEAVILQMLPRGFPYVNKEIGLKYSDALLCHQRGLRDSRKAVYRAAIELMGISDVLRLISAQKDKVSIFERFGYVEKDGAPIRVRTHQLRHYLNTLAQAGGLSQLDVAVWSGRADIHQNGVYDHVSDRDALAVLDENTRDDRHVPATFASRRKAVLIKRDEFERLQVKTAHTTEFGFCVHDFAMLPCQLHMDCLNCDEHLCLKGDKVRNENLRRWRDETKALLEHSKAAESDGIEGADRWTQHQTRTLTRVEQIIELYEDQTVPNGAVIQPAWGSVASWIEQGHEERRLLDKMRPAGPAETVLQEKTP